MENKNRTNQEEIIEEEFDLLMWVKGELEVDVQFSTTRASKRGVKHQLSWIPKSDCLVVLVTNSYFSVLSSASSIPLKYSKSYLVWFSSFYRKCKRGIPGMLMVHLQYQQYIFVVELVYFSASFILYCMYFLRNHLDTF